MTKPMNRALPLLVALLALVTSALAGEVETRVSSQTLRAGDTLELLLRYRGEAPARPDLTPLEADFDVLDVRTSQRTSVINGVRDESTDWILSLAPRKSGTLSVPELVVGDTHSQAFELHVSDASSSVSDVDQPTAAVIFEVEVDDDHPYVQGEVRLTARVLLDETIREGALTEPELEGALLERAGDDQTSTVVRNGKSYTQIERQYALFPQRSGVVRIPPLTFEAVQRTPSRGRGRRSLFDDPFGSSPFDDFFGPGGGPFGGSSAFGGSLFDDFFDQGRPVRFRSNALELNVQSKPEAARGQWWLPAKHVQLVEEWEPDPPVFRVGEQVRRRIAIQALGLSGSQMPAIELEQVEGLKQYPQPAFNDTLAANDETIAVRVQDFELLPTRPGDLTLPAIEVQWWDLEADQARTAVLPARTVSVLPGDPSVVASVAPSAAPPSSEAPDVGPALDAPRTEPELWPYAALAGATLSLLIAALVAGRRRSRAVHESKPVHAPSLHKAEAKLTHACRNGNVSDAACALLDIGRARWPQDPPLDPAALAARLGDEQLARATAELVRSRFAGDAEEWAGEDLLRAYSAAMRAQRKQRKAPTDTPLPALYPTT